MRNPSPLVALADKPESLQVSLAQGKAAANQLAETPDMPTRYGQSIRPAGEKLGLNPGEIAFGQAVGTPDGGRAAQDFINRINRGPFAYIAPDETENTGGVA